jgi:hypothetical protein
MSSFLKRAAAVLAGVVLGMVAVAGAGPWRDRPLKRDAVPTPPASAVPRERAPDTRV